MRQRPKGNATANLFGGLDQLLGSRLGESGGYGRDADGRNNLACGIRDGDANTGNALEHQAIIQRVAQLSGSLDQIAYLVSLDPQFWVFVFMHVDDGFNLCV